MWRLREEAKGAQLALLTAQIQQLAAAMQIAIPGVSGLDVRENCLPSSDGADLLLRGEFESWEALHGYEIHPLHLQLRELLAPLRSEKRVVDYET